MTSTVPKKRKLWMEKKTAVLGDTTSRCVDDMEDAVTSLVANECMTVNSLE